MLRGIGDPTLASADLDALAATIRARGIRGITGWIRGDESFFDTRRGAAGWKRGWVGIESPRSPRSPSTAPRLAGAVAAAARREGASGRRSAGTASPWPAASGLGRAGGRRARRRTVGAARAHRRDMDRDSDNYKAELLLKALGASDRRQVGSTAARRAVVMEELRAAGVDTTGVRIADGSGLSSLDRSRRPRSSA